MFNIQLANTLPNGAEILQRKPSVGQPYWVALGYLLETCSLSAAYGVWEVSENDGALYNGTCFETFEEAQAEYFFRS